MNLYLIRRGSHYANTGWFRLPRITFKDTVTFDAVFLSNCLYDPKSLGADKDDINKLYGLTSSFSSSQSSSARIGWKATDHGTISLWAYVNYKGKHTAFGMGECKPNQKLRFIIEDKGDYFKFLYKENVITINKPYNTNKLFNVRFKLNPYFGGNKPAPHTMLIGINETH